MPVITSPELVGPAVGAALVAVASLAHGGYRWWRWRATAGWSETQARVDATDVLVGSDLAGPVSHTWRSPRVRFRYRVDGEWYHGSFAYPPLPSDPQERAEVERRRQERGDRLMVRYDPRRPTRVVPTHHVERAAVRLLMSGVLAAGLAVWLYLEAVER